MSSSIVVASAATGVSNSFGQAGYLSDYHLSVADRFPSEEALQLAAANRPLQEMMAFVQEAKNWTSPDEASITPDSFAIAYLRKLWDKLATEEFGSPLGSFTPIMELKENYQAEQAWVDEYVALHESMTIQSEGFQRIYEKFATARSLFAFLSQKNLLTWESLVPREAIPWIMAIAPVWFEENVSHDRRVVGNQQAITNHMVYHVFKTRRLGIWFQMWNQSPQRQFNTYKGDVLPPQILALIKEIKEAKQFDHLIVATPYHELAIRSWKQKRLVDPYLFGVSRVIPDFFFYLGRWSQTGLFPLAQHMLAQTMRCVEENEVAITGLELRNWQLPERPKSDGMGFAPESTEMIRFHSDALAQYKEGNFYAWLTEGLNPSHP